MFECTSCVSVALLAEGVDRNTQTMKSSPAGEYVALLAEGVDRNLEAVRPMGQPAWSPSSRRAWIEIVYESER